MHLHDHLLAREQSVGDELASSDCHLRVGHVCDVMVEGELSRNEAVKAAMRFVCEISNYQCAWHW